MLAATVMFARVARVTHRHVTRLRGGRCVTSTSPMLMRPALNKFQLGQHAQRVVWTCRNRRTDQNQKPCRRDVEVRWATVGAFGAGIKGAVLNVSWRPASFRMICRSRMRFRKRF